MPSTSVSLLERIRSAEEVDAWDRFADLYTPLLYEWARRMGLEQEDAADVVQDVFATLVKKMPEFQYDPKKSFRGWLRTLIMNRTRDLYRRRATVKFENIEGHGVAESIDDAALIVENDEYRKYLVTRAMHLMQSDFQETTWRACWLLVVEDRSVDEVAAELSMTANACYVAKSRVLRRLREELEGLWE